MKSFKIRFKRLTASVLSLVVVFASVSGAFSVFAAVSSSDYEILTDCDYEGLTPQNSVVDGVTMEYTMDGGASFSPLNLPSTANLTDSNPATQQEIYNPGVSDGQGGYKALFYDYKLPSTVGAKYLDGSQRKLRITLALKGKINVNNILVACGGTGTAASDLALAEYKIFASEKKADLYTSNAVFTHRYDNLTNKKTAQNFKFNQNALSGVKFVGMEIYNPHINWADGYVAGNGAGIFYPRIREFNVYGTIIPETVAFDNGGIPSEGEKGDLALVSGGITVASYRNGVQKMNGGVNAAALIDEDGSNSPSFMLGGAPYAFYQENGEKWDDGAGGKADTTVDFVIPIKAACTVNKIFFSNEGATASNYTKKYEIYAANSDERAELFKAENRIEYIYNENSTARQIITVGGNDGLSKAYIGVRILDPIDYDNFLYFNKNDNNNYAVPRIKQIGVYGKDHSTDDKIPDGNNFLLGMLPTITHTKADGSTYNPVESPANIFTNITDGDVTTQYYTSMAGGAIDYAYYDKDSNKCGIHTDGTVHTDYTFDLGGTAKVEKIYFRGASGAATRTGAYKVYASDKMANLFDDANMVADINNIDSVKYYDVIDFATPLEGIRYISVRIINPIGTTNIESGLMQIKKDPNKDAVDGSCNVYPRVNEIAAIGQYSRDVWTYKKVTKLSTYTFPYGMDFTGLTFLNHVDTTLKPKSTWFNTMDNTTANAAVINPTKIADGNHNTDIALNTLFAEYSYGTVNDYTKGKLRWQDVWYDLKSEADLSFINIMFPYNPMWAAGNYAVYIGNDEATLFDGEPYAEVDNYTDFTVNNEGYRTNVVAFDKSDETPDTARFVGIRIYNPISVDVGSSEVTTVTESRNNIYG